MKDNTSLLEEYEKYQKARTDGDISFGTITFLQSLGSMLGQKCYNNLAPSIIHHNSYVSLIGDSSRSRKTTIQDIIKRLYDWKEDYFMPDNVSPEQLLIELEKNPNTIWWYGEWSKMLKRMDSKHWLSDIIEYMNEMFTCPAEYSKSIKGKQGNGEKVIIKYPHLCFNTTCTEEMLVKYANEDMIDGGYFARFILVHGKSKSGMRKKLSPKDREQYGKMVKILRALDDIVYNSTLSGHIVFELTDDALERHYKIEKRMYNQEKTSAFAGRYSNYIVAFADILMVSDKLGGFFNKPEVAKKLTLNEIVTGSKTGNIMVEKEYIDKAWEILKPHYEYTREIIESVQCDRPVRLLTRYLLRQKRDGRKYVPRSEAMNYTNLNTNEMKLAVDTMTENGTLASRHIGRKSKVLLILSESSA